MRRFRLVCLTSVILLAGCRSALAEDYITYEPAHPVQRQHIVFISGDEEYRSEEGLPMLAKILSQRHGFRCTVLFSVGADGTVDPTNQSSLTGAEMLDSADAIVMLVRYRNWPDEDAKHFVDAFHRGIPIIALRTSTHGFQYREDRAASYRWLNDFGKQVLGEEWVSHWGRHKIEATVGVAEPSAMDDPILRGVADVFGDTDVYEAYPPADARILVRGKVLRGMSPNDVAAAYEKKRRSDGQAQDVNQPMMPVAWTRVFQNDAGTSNRIFCTTMGAATDLRSEGLRRLIVNSVYWGLKMDVPAAADVAYVDPYEPSAYGFDGFRKGIRVEDHELGKTLPASR